MDRDTAVTRINDGLGFLPSGHSLESKIILRLQEAQRDLEKGKTLPKFLLQENQTLSLVAGTSTVALPTGFLRESDETRLRYLTSDSDVPAFLQRKYFIDAELAILKTQTDDQAPRVYVIRKATIDFIANADVDYTLYWDYYKAADVLTTNIENAWLANAPEWLIGEAGRRIAADARDAEAVSLFTEIRQAGRAAVFGEDIAAEQASGPIVMGANL